MGTKCAGAKKALLSVLLLFILGFGLAYYHSRVNPGSEFISLFVGTGPESSLQPVHSMREGLNRYQQPVCTESVQSRSGAEKTKLIDTDAVLSEPDQNEKIRSADSVAESASAVSIPRAADGHTHAWVHHDAVTHIVHHDALYGTVHHNAWMEKHFVVDVPAVYRSVFYCSCGYCTRSEQEILDHAYNASWDEIHSQSVLEEVAVPEEGHWEESIETPAYDEEVLIREAWDEVVIDVPAYEECSVCGARQ